MAIPMEMQAAKGPPQDLRAFMFRRPKIQIPRGMECGMCGVEFWTHTVNHWYVCRNPRCHVDAAVKS